MKPLLLRRCAVAFACSLLLAARAATVTVAVTGADGQPAPNVVVQLTPAHPVTRPVPTSALIAQKDIRFVPYVTAVPVGTTVRFSNQDPFDHHLRSQPGGPAGTIAPAKDFEFRIAATNGDKVSSTELRFDKPGFIVLGCHLHSSMRGHLFISETPFVAVTDATGHAVITDVPEGSAELRTWHPDQLVDQAPSTRQITGAAIGFDGVLNFTPPKLRQRRS